MLAIGDLVGSDGGSLSVPGLEVSAVPCIVISWIAFLLGVASLVVFALKNLPY